MTQPPPHGAQHGPYTYDARIGQWVLTAPAPVAGYPAGQPAPMAPSGNKRRWPWVVGAVLGTLLVVLLLDSIAWGGSHTEPDPQQAVSLCERLVRDGSRSPSTVTFVGTAANPAGQNAWNVVGKADGQNQFGGIERVAFTCEVTYDPEDSSYHGTITEVKDQSN